MFGDLVSDMIISKFDPYLVFHTSDFVLNKKNKKLCIMT